MTHGESAMLMQTLSKADVQPQALPNTIGVDTPLFANQVEKPTAMAPMP